MPAPRPAHDWRPRGGLVHLAPPAEKVSVTLDELSPPKAHKPTNLPPGAKEVTILNVRCIVWERGGMFWGADLMSKLKKRSGIRTPGADSEDEAIEQLRQELAPPPQ